MANERGQRRKRNGLIPLQSTYVYGPIASRRLGNSLGINPFPLGRKVCSFNCVYCQYGYTPSGALRGNEATDGFPDIETIARALEIRLENLKGIGVELNYITFAGNGEPTLYPGFSELVDAVGRMRDEYYPAAKTTILSNSTLTAKKDVRDGLNSLDERIMKLDVGSEEMLKKVNSPVGEITLERIIEGLGGLKSCILQSLFIRGSVTNSDDGSVAGWMNAVKKIRPLFVQIYSIDRVPAERGLEIVDRKDLEGIARSLFDATGVESKVY